MDEWQHFRQYLEHVKKHANASKNNKMLLILDGHSSHTKSIEVLDYASQMKSARQPKYLGRLWKMSSRALDLITVK